MISFPKKSIKRSKLYSLSIGGPNLDVGFVFPAIFALFAPNGGAAPETELDRRRDFAGDDLDLDGDLGAGRKSARQRHRF